MSKSIDEKAREAWQHYNPEWLIEKIQEDAYSLVELHTVFLAAFKMGVAFKLTGEVQDYE